MVTVFPYGTCTFCEAGLWPTNRPSRPRSICDDIECRRAANRYGAQRINAILARQRRENPPTEKRCPRCGETKPLTTEYWYVEQRDEAGEVIRYHGWCKPCKRRANHHDVPENVKQARRERKREQAAERREQARSDPQLAAELRAANTARKRKWRRAHPEAVREIQRRYRQRVNSDPERVRRRREANRMAYRLRRERETGRLGERERNEGTREDGGHHDFPALPARPLAGAIDQALRAGGIDPQGNGGNAERALRDMGIEVRSLTAWRSGERKTVQFDVADNAMCQLELTWFDVWPPDEHPQVARLFEGETAGAPHGKERPPARVEDARGAAASTRERRST